jgi:hypothetical protein
MENNLKIFVIFMIYVIDLYVIIFITNDYIFRNMKIVMFILTLFEYFLKISFTFFWRVGYFFYKSFYEF